MEMDSAMDLDSNLDEAADYTSMSCPELNLCTQSQKRKAAVVDDSDESEDLCSDGPRVLRATRVSCSSHEKDDMELSTLNDTDSEGYYCTLVKRMPRKLMSIKPTLEQLPKEVINKVATLLSSDEDLRNLIASSPVIADTLVSDHADVWRSRFLAHYDYPLVNSALEFEDAYRLRRFVLRTLSKGLAIWDSAQMTVQLETVRDLVVEAYNKHPNPYIPAPTVSKNLSSAASPTYSKWMLNLLSAPRYVGSNLPAPGSGVSNRLASRQAVARSSTTPEDEGSSLQAIFEVLQVTLSYLLLSPMSMMAYAVSAQRENYDIALVYCWNRQLVTLWQKKDSNDNTIDSEGDTIMHDSDEDGEVEISDTDSSPAQKWSTLFPNLKRRKLKKDRNQYKMEMHTLLHIRNFWHRHLIDESRVLGGSKWLRKDDDRPTYLEGTVTIESTYAGMAKGLAKLDQILQSSNARNAPKASLLVDFDQRTNRATATRRVPGPWTQGPLSDDVANQPRLQRKWWGHYSCMYPWPKKLEQLEERQSCAETWSEIDPMVLDLTSTTNPKAGFWPRIFASIPIIKDSIPPPEWFGFSSRSGDSDNAKDTPSLLRCYEFIMGLAPFLDLKAALKPQQKHPSATASPPTLHTGVSTITVSNSTESTLPRRTTGSLSLPRSARAKPKTASSLGSTKYHPFLSLRVRGIIHPVPSHLDVTEDFKEYTQPELAGIPGWRRIVMVMYKPSTRYLVQVLERAMGEFGDPFLQMVPSLVQTLGAAAGAAAGGAAQVVGAGGGGGAGGPAQGHGPSPQQQQQQAQGQSQNQQQSALSAGAATGALAPAASMYTNGTTGSNTIPTATAAAAAAVPPTPLTGQAQAVTTTSPAATASQATATAPAPQQPIMPNSTNLTAPSTTPAQIEEALTAILERRVTEFEAWYRRSKKPDRPAAARTRRGKEDHHHHHHHHHHHDDDEDEDEDSPSPLWTAPQISRLEHPNHNHPSSPALLQWDDIDYAYAYDGILLPGGRMMMGRWWRTATAAGGGDDGVAMEWVADNGREDGRRGGERERGPFVFWC